MMDGLDLSAFLPADVAKFLPPVTGLTFFLSRYAKLPANLQPYWLWVAAGMNATLITGLAFAMKHTDPSELAGIAIAGALSSVVVSYARHTQEAPTQGPAKRT